VRPYGTFSLRSPMPKGIGWFGPRYKPLLKHAPGVRTPASLMRRQILGNFVGP
jgi:hypothetical protein